MVERIVPPEVHLDIDARDEMYDFCLRDCHGWRDNALVHYFRSAALGARAMNQVLAWFQGAGSPPPRVLDFASGFGRTTRFLVRDLAADSLWVSDIQSGTVDYQRRHFGVHGLAATLRPEDFDPAQRFDVIFTLSLFSHLPDAAFAAWLSRLFSLLSPDGCLFFSTHGERCLPSEHRLNGAGFCFSSTSESRSLSVDDYGTMWCSAEYVAEKIGALGPSATWRRYPRALWHLQDVFVVSKGKSLDDLRLTAGVEGHLETAALEPTGELTLAGWAVDHDDDAQVTIEVQVGDGPVTAIAPGDPRPDVRRVLDSVGGAPLGWSTSYRHPGRRLRPDDVIVVSARCPGADYLIHAGSVEGTLLGKELYRLHRALRAADDRFERAARELAVERRESEGLAERLRWMERSRFWKMRNAWFRLKRLV